MQASRVYKFRCTAKSCAPCVALDAGAPRPTMQDLIQFARARGGYKAPEEIIVLDKMPLDATGKVDRVTLKKWTAARLGPTARGAG